RGERLDGAAAARPGGRPHRAGDGPADRAARALAHAMSGTAVQPASAAPPTRRLGRRIIPCVAAGLAGCWLGGLVWFAATIPGEVADPDAATDAIVVLTGGSQRLDAGLELLAAGKAKMLFVSGVHQGVALADLLRLSRPVPAALTPAIVLGHDA